MTLLAVAGSASGDEPIFASKWAMDVQDYARVHSDPYSDDPRIRRMQMRRERWDARFQDSIYGGYVGGGSALTTWSEADLDAGLFRMPTAWSTLRMGGIGLVASGDFMGGGEFGARLHTPTRLAPYVGLTSLVAMSGVRRHISYNRYYYDNGQRLNNPRWGYFPTGMAAIAPEVGLSYWLTPYTRLNVGTGYYFTTRGQPNFLMVNMSLDFAARGSQIQTPPPLPEGEEEPYFVPNQYYFGVPRYDAPPPFPVPEPLPLDVPDNPLPRPLLLPDNATPPAPAPSLDRTDASDLHLPWEQLATSDRSETGADRIGLPAVQASAIGVDSPEHTTDDLLASGLSARQTDGPLVDCQSIRERTPRSVFH
ncbi:MAG: hypothetical protein JSS49_12165 [Planctomycetes bacterium]|nr:hypothetical protein [Planctomycetota bacterium]